MPYPARTTVCFIGFQAMPMRGAKLLRSGLIKDRVEDGTALTEAAGLHRWNQQLGAGKTGSNIQVRDLIVCFRVGPVVFIAQAEIERETGPEAEIILRVNIKGVGAEIIGIGARLQASLLRQAKQEIGEVVPGVGSRHAAAACCERRKAVNTKLPSAFLRRTKTLQNAAIVSAKRQLCLPRLQERVSEKVKV